MDKLSIILDSGLDWGWAAIITASCCLLVTIPYPRKFRQICGGRWKFPLFFRGIAGIALVLLILRPDIVIHEKSASPYNSVALLDCSASMSIPNGSDTVLSLSAAAARETENSFNQQENYNFTVFPFSDQPFPAAGGQDIMALEAKGNVTAIAMAIDYAANQRPTPDEIILLSDGNDTASPAAAIEAAKKYKIPINTVKCGINSASEKNKISDVVLSQVQRSDRLPVGSAAQITAFIQNTGFSGKTANVILRENGKNIGKSELMLDSGQTAQSVMLAFAPQSTGLHELELLVEPLAGEATIANNRIVFPIQVHEKLPRVLYIESELKPEYKFLRRALASDPGIEFMSLGRINGGIFLRQGEISGLTLDKLPTNPAELAAIDVLILGNFSADELGSSLPVIAGAVNNGLGLIVLSGNRTTGENASFTGTPLTPVLPYNPTRIVVSTPITPLLHNTVLSPGKELARLFPETMQGTPLPGIDRLGVVPGAHVVMQGKNGNIEYPLLICKDTGKYRSAVFAGHESWRWRGKAAPNFESFWGQMVRWAAGDDNSPLPSDTITATISTMLCRPEQEVSVRASVPDNPDNPVDKVYAIIKKNDKNIIRQALSPNGIDNRDWSGTFTPDSPGEYTVTVREFRKDGKHREVELQLRVQPTRSEFASTSPNRQLLMDIAQSSGGTYYDSINQFLQRSLPGLKDSGKEKIIHLWNTLILLLLASLMLSLEWFLRKKAGLP